MAKPIKARKVGEVWTSDPGPPKKPKVTWKEIVMFLVGVFMMALWLSAK